MNKYLLFDLDGTLSDSGPGVTRSAQYALEKFGIKVDDPDDLKFFLGPPLKTSFMEFYGFSEEDAAKAIEYYRERYRPIGIFENSLFPGVKHPANPKIWYTLSLKPMGLRSVLTLLWGLLSRKDSLKKTQ